MAQVLGYDLDDSLFDLLRTTDSGAYKHGWRAMILQRAGFFSVPPTPVEEGGGGW